MGVSPCCVVVRIQFNTDPGSRPATVDDQCAQFIERMVEWMMDERLGVPDDVLIG